MAAQARVNARMSDLERLDALRAQAAHPNAAVGDRTEARLGILRPVPGTRLKLGVWVTPEGDLQFTLGAG